MGALIWNFLVFLIRCSRKNICKQPKSRSQGPWPFVALCGSLALHDWGDDPGKGGNQDSCEPHPSRRHNRAGWNVSLPDPASLSRLRSGSAAPPKKCGTRVLRKRARQLSTLQRSRYAHVGGEPACSPIGLEIKATRPGRTPPRNPSEFMPLRR